MDLKHLENENKILDHVLFLMNESKKQQEKIQRLERRITYLEANTTSQ